MTEAASDARTAPVAVWQVLEKMTKEEREAWRVADIPNRPTAEQRNLDIGFPFGWYPFMLARSTRLGRGQACPLLRP
jgi:3-ketosteroid 9alpha-monooxygenase subunit A